jgi:hypothetical protein
VGLESADVAYRMTVRFEVLTTVSNRIAVLWDLTPFMFTMEMEAACSSEAFSACVPKYTATNVEDRNLRSFLFIKAWVQMLARRCAA